MKQVVRKKIAEKYNISNEKPIYTLLLDINSIMKQSLVDKSRKNTKGEDYGMVYQSIIAIGNILTKYDFNFCYALYDADKSGQLRFNLMPEYKQNRDKNYEIITEKSDYAKAVDEKIKKWMNKVKNSPKKEVKRDELEEESFNRQRNLLYDILENLFVRNYKPDEYVEGDDLIAFYVKNKKPNEKIVIATRDRDLTQLIKDDVSVYLLDLKKFISPKNHKEVMGYVSDNVVIKKLFTGDSSDNIKGIKGVGEKTFFDLFPKAKDEKVTVEEIIEEARLINEERVKNKKKPLKSCENIVNAITDGCQGTDIYEINKKIIDLSEPLMTEEAEEYMNALMYAQIDPEGRDFKELYKLVQENGMIDLLKEYKFSEIFAPFNKLIENEKKYKGE